MVTPNPAIATTTDGARSMDAELVRPPARVGRSIFAAIVLGVLIVGVLGFWFDSQCGGTSLSGKRVTFCSTLAKNPPWLLLSGLLTAPSLLLTWYWKTLAKNGELHQKNQDLANRRLELLHQTQVFAAQRDDATLSHRRLVEQRKDRQADVLERVDAKFSSREVTQAREALDRLPNIGQLVESGEDPSTLSALSEPVMLEIEPLLRFYVFLKAMLDLEQVDPEGAKESYRYWLGLASDVRGTDQVPQFERLVRTYWPSLASWLEVDARKQPSEQFFALR